MVRQKCKMANRLFQITNDSKTKGSYHFLFHFGFYFSGQADEGFLDVIA